MKRTIIRMTSKNARVGACIPNCPEGAMQIVDGKARLVSDLSATDSARASRLPRSGDYHRRS